jgi:hypothetical protein
MLAGAVDMTFVPELRHPAGPAAPRVTARVTRLISDNHCMSLAELLSGRVGLAGRLPQQLDDLRGPSKGVVVLPRHLSWPGMREFDVTDDSIRRSMYGILLTQGRRNEVARFLNARLLMEDWPLIRTSLDPKLRRWCERRFALRSEAEVSEQHG